jgi:hypothetical protein
MAAALGRAEQVYLAARPALPELEVDGLAIRLNVNDPRVLSFHALGWAIDIDPKRNPNVPLTKLASEGVPNVWQLVREITGADVFTRDPSGRSVRGPETGTVTEAAGEAQRLAAISQEFQAAFASLDAWQATLEGYAERQGMQLTDSQRTALFTELRGVTPRRATAVQQRLEALLFEWWLVNRNRQRQREAAEPLGLPPLRAPAGLRPTSMRLAPDFKRIAATAVQMAIAFAARSPGGKVVSPAEIASVGSLTAHGFMNLDPLLVGALAGSDGGGLTWLGKTVSERGARDTMHFELKHPPRLPREAPPTRTDAVKRLPA